MNIYGIGTDIIKNSRIRNSIKKEKFINRVFVKKEVLESKNKRDKLLFFSKRFAAKEALVKALGTGFRHNISFQDMSILNNKKGKPYFLISNNLRKIIKNKLKINKFKIFLSMSDEKNYSIAYVVIQKVK
tara:strand:- start:202 stop:591 length:390 start_codon:yes stop_codon:yes gene_type:complete